MGCQPKTDLHGNKVASPPLTRRDRIEAAVAIIVVACLILAFANGLARLLIYLSEHR